MKYAEHDNSADLCRGNKLDWLFGTGSPHLGSSMADFYRLLAQCLAELVRCVLCQLRVFQRRVIILKY